MKRYTLRAAIHDAKIFDQLRREYRRTRKHPRKHSSSRWLSRYLAAMRHISVAARSFGGLRRRWQHAVEVLAIIILLR
jgi:hypothetical protein